MPNETCTVPPHNLISHDLSDPTVSVRRWELSGEGRLGEREGTRRHVNVDWCYMDDLVGEMEEC
jgi:hypothetical protein